MEKGVQRWFVNVSEWSPSGDEFYFLLSLLPPHEHSAITRFVKLEDRKRALVSRLLQYALVHEVLGIPFDEIIIKRTVEGKPYLEYNKQNLEFPNFNFNASHHGDYVAIASEPLCLVGLDIVSLLIPKQETTHDFIGNFSSYLTGLEWENIIKAGTSDDILGQFYRYWCLKEAFVKAIGAGMGYGLDKLEFHHNNWTNISIHVDGDELKQWRFSVSELGEKHWVSIARGHPQEAIESYRKVLNKVEFEEHEYHFGLQLPNRGFVLRKVGQLVPVSHRASY
uniref:holo-[acyl-carrier-protein] synthase n=1 Tax=Nelumbo nucifera TaxID=4432 RepID=A0A822ZIG6_NELNU|nr:TPA_asm: hypothetical protein HUJ06_001389 [Nelumbo nucifera]